MLPRRQDDHADGADGGRALSESADDDLYLQTAGRPLIRRPWLLALAIAAAWFPIASYWQSDDFLAITYGQDFTAAGSDFLGPQYGLESLVLFLRPLISLSFACDALAGDLAPLVSHLGNALAHGVSAMCLALLVSRFRPNREALAAGIVWGLAPCHASSIFWAVGRVDSFTTLWLILSALSLVKWCGYEARSRGPALICFALALCCKELAWVMPGIAAVIGAGMARPGRRWEGGSTTAWPFLVLLAIYFGWRYLALGQVFGGYEATLQPGPAASGLASRTAQLANPLLQGGFVFAEEHLVSLPPATAWIGYLPVALALGVVSWRRRFGFLAVLVALYLGCALPNAQVFADADNPMILRQFYLAMMPVAVLLASGGWLVAGLTLACAALPLCELHQDYRESWARCARWHDQIREVVPRSNHDLNFIVGLPRQNLRATTVEFHLFVDRLLVPPFGDGEHRVFALRPLHQDPARFTIPYGADAELPLGATFALDGDRLAAVNTAPKVAAMGHEVLGPAFLDLAVLDRVVENFKRRQAGVETEGIDPAILLPRVRAKLYRVTVFTGSGSITTFVPDTAQPGSEHGRVDLGLVLYGHADRSEHRRVGGLLQTATALDLSTRFPLLIEADTRRDAAVSADTFQATHANFSPAWLSLDRRFANWWPE